MAGKKRAREDTEEEVHPEEIAARKQADDEAPASEPPVENYNAKDDIDGDNEDDAPLVSNYKMSRAVCSGHECPYLDSISRQVCSYLSTK
jgi:hypothetical protein